MSRLMGLHSNARYMALREHTHMPPIGRFAWSGCHDQGVAAGSPASSRPAMLPADVGVRLQPGRPEESGAGGLQAHTGHDAGAYW
jgi:hypothetical protein